MLGRRSFLISASSLALTQILSGCSSSNNGFKIIFLQGSLPLQSIRRFVAQLNRSNQVVFKTKPQLEQLLSLLAEKAETTNLKQANLLLARGDNNTIDLDLVTLGDYWLTSAIKQDLIQPLQLEKLENWGKLPLNFQNLVRRDSQGKINETGSIWGAPYRWGTTAIAYRRDKLQKLGIEKITDWSDLWREELRDRISLLNQPRQVIGLTLKKLGYSFNTSDLTKIPQLKTELLKLHQQTRLYDSTNYLQPLILGDTWLAVGWSGDILPILKTSAQIEAIIPQSGTSLWADLWVKSKFSQADPQASLSKKWIDFCWDIPTVNEISILTDAASPLVFSLDRPNLNPDIFNRPLLFPDPAIIDRSEFLLPLPLTSERQYLDLWQEIRSS